MGWRARLVPWTFRGREWLEAFLPCLLNEEALIELNGGHFSGSARFWIEQADAGLFPEEAVILERLPAKSGRALCLASGGGREAFALARRGFSVLGVEQVPELVHFAQDYAQSRGLDCRFLRSSLTEVALNGERYDLISAANIAYSYVPSRAARVRLLRGCLAVLKPEGRCVLSVAVRQPSAGDERRSRLFTVVGRLAGNPRYEAGDRLVGDGNFIHFFPTLEAVAGEALEAGFYRCERFQSAEGGSYAILAK